MPESYMHEEIDEDILLRARTILENSVSDSDSISKEYLKRRQWAAVPVESALHFDDADIDRIVTAAKNCNIPEFLAIRTEEIREPYCYRLSADYASLAKFSKKCSHWKYLLVAIDESFMILCTVEEYFLIAGPRWIVELIAGRSIKLARLEFHRYADSAEWHESVRTLLLEVERRYALYDG
jgi:hypothetical protein